MSDEINNNYPAAPDFASESPINLPSNQPKAEYGSDLIAEIMGALGHEYRRAVLGAGFQPGFDAISAVAVPVHIANVDLDSGQPRTEPRLEQTRKS